MRREIIPKIPYPKQIHDVVTLSVRTHTVIDSKALKYNKEIFFQIILSLIKIFYITTFLKFFFSNSNKLL